MNVSRRGLVGVVTMKTYITMKTYYSEGSFCKGEEIMSSKPNNVIPRASAKYQKLFVLFQNLSHFAYILVYSVLF